MREENARGLILMETPTVRHQMEKIIKRYSNEVGKHLDGEFSERDVATKFILPLVQLLGWNILDMDDVREEYTHGNYQIDLILLMNDRPIVVFDLKPFKYGLVTNEEKTSVQYNINKLLDAASELKAKYAVLTRFRDMVIYSVETRKRLLTLHVSEYNKKIDELWNILSKKSFETT